MQKKVQFDGKKKISSFQTTCPPHVSTTEHVFCGIVLSVSLLPGKRWFPEPWVGRIKRKFVCSKRIFVLALVVDRS